MKAKLIVINWVVAWFPLCYAGESAVIALGCVGWFCFSTWLLLRHKKVALKELDKWDKWVNRIYSKNTAIQRLKKRRKMRLLKWDLHCRKITSFEKCNE